MIKGINLITLYGIEITVISGCMGPAEAQINVRLGCKLCTRSWMISRQGVTEGVIRLPHSSWRHSTRHCVGYGHRLAPHTNPRPSRHRHASWKADLRVWLSTFSRKSNWFVFVFSRKTKCSSKLWWPLFILTLTKPCAVRFNTTLKD